MLRNHALTGFFSLSITLLLAVALPLRVTDRPTPATPESATTPRAAAPARALIRTRGDQTEIYVRSADQLAAIFDRYDYAWPLDGDNTVPPVEVTTLPLGLEKLETAQRKALFFRTLLPIVLMENARISRDRALLVEAFRSSVNSWTSTRRSTIAAVARRYRVKGDLDDVAVREELLRRVDRIPAGLVLAQAANESGWGTSRFSRIANNLFGVWTYEKSRGIAPSASDSDSRHAVRVYHSLREAVRAYLFNINVGHAYTELRELRADMRRNAQPLDPLALAAGLVRYSERGEAYVEEIRRMIKGNRLGTLGDVTLAEEAPR